MTDVLRHGNDRDTFRLTDPRIRIGKHDQLPATRTHFLQVRLELFEQIVVRGNHDDRHIGIDQRERTVLELPGRIRFGVDVGNLLELERAFKRNRIHLATAEEKRVMLVGEPLGELLDPRLQMQCLFDERRDLDQPLHEAAFSLGIGAMELGQCDDQQAKRRQLRRERLG
ncbi:unannotated protein [freshwater metagenome]|uniref:Unannotated protein n=1 Tax=freshwater metagenome TaxID=449393 RepID=A0A6J7RIS2_9ZZZZ